MAKPSLVQIVPRIAQRAGRESVARLRLYFVGYVTVKRQGNLMKVWLLTAWMMDSTNFAVTEFSEVRHSPGPTPRSVPDSELSRDRRPPRKAAVPFARAPSPCSRGQAFPCGSKHPPARCSSLCRSLRYRCGGMRKPCGEVAFDIPDAAMYSVAMYTRIRVR